ncbi:hypothetical protein [Micromonospora sp. NPDC051006]|uniref:hypothetical protein n=1 Tax=Micromonospora sp. NPDC051006 TaxID=3364283 RepID=UPI0037A78050
MLLWDYEMKPLRDELPTIPPARRLAVAVSVLDWTLQAAGEIEDAEVRSYLAEGLRIGHESVRAGRDEMILPEDMLDAYEDVYDSSDEPGTAHLMSAILACVDAPEGLTGEVLYGVLSSCYEGLLDRERLPIWTVEAERENARCLETIAYQKRIVDEALGR